MTPCVTKKQFLTSKIQWQGRHRHISLTNRGDKEIERLDRTRNQQSKCEVLRLHACHPEHTGMGAGPPTAWAASPLQLCEAHPMLQFPQGGRLISATPVGRAFCCSSEPSFLLGSIVVWAPYDDAYLHLGPQFVQNILGNLGWSLSGFAGLCPCGRSLRLPAELCVLPRLGWHPAGSSPWWMALVAGTSTFPGSPQQLHPAQLPLQGSSPAAQLWFPSFEISVEASMTPEHLQPAHLQSRHHGDNARVWR